MARYHTVALSKTERLLIEIAHSDHKAMKDNADAIFQGRLSAVTEDHGVPDGSQVRFVKSDKGEMSLEWETEGTDLKLTAEEEAADAMPVADEGQIDEDGEQGG